MKFLPSHSEQYETGCVSSEDTHLLMPHYDSWQVVGDFGCVISQHFKSNGYAIHKHIFSIKQPTFLYALPSRHILTINYALRGSPVALLPMLGRVTLEENSFQLFYTPPGKHEIWFEPGEYESVHIVFDPSLLSNMQEIDPAIVQLYENSINKSEYLSMHGTGTIDAGVLRLINTAMRPKKQRWQMELHVVSVTTQLLHQYLKRHRSASRDHFVQQSLEDMLASVKDYILLHPDKPLTLEALARTFKTSRDFLKRYFPKVFGLPISEFVLKSRMDKAAEYLSSGKFNVSEVASRIGYSLPAFCKAFKNYHGIPAGKLFFHAKQAACAPK